MIGDSATSTTRASSGASNRANQAGNGAGIYNNGGSVFIGCNSSGTAATGDALVNDDTDGHYGVRRNYSSSNGAGIYHAAGTLKIASGDISCNSGTDYSNGGGIYFAAGASIGGGTFSNGYAKNGGGLYIKSGVEVTLTGGASFTQNEAASTGNGGAVYQGGTFNMSGSAYIAPGSERSNDVYLASGKTVAITGALNPPSGVSSVATISLGSYSRGRDILSSNSANAENLSDAIEKFKLSQDDSGWDRGNNLATSETAKKVWITSPIYVVGASGTYSTKPTGFEYGKTTGANGTKTSPYASVAAALAADDLALATEPNTITIAGTLVGAQQVISSPSVDITLKGYKAAGVETSDAKILRWSSKKTTQQSNGSVLNVDADGKTVTITDLTLSYGYNGYGGGIYITKGTVKLGDYAKICDNQAGNSGGGVYVSDGATLFMYGKALIGDKLSTDTGVVTATSTDYGNYAQYQGGGGIYNGGAVYIGYSGFDTDGTTLIESSIDNGYGVIRGWTMNEGGGAIRNNGTLKIKSGSISYNRSSTQGGAIRCYSDATISGGTFESNVALSGGAILINASKTLTIDGNATFKNNQAKNSGGAISNSGTLTMTAGTIGESGALNRIIEGETGDGGAIYQNGTFNISGSAYVYPGSEKSNDVYLASGKSVSVNGSWSGSQSSSSKMTLTPATWTRGTAVVTKGSSSSAVDITTDIVSMFSVSDSEWSAVLAGSGASAAGKIDAEIWLSSSDETDATRSTGVGQGSDSNSGTKSKPYATLAMAVAQCWKGPNDTVVESGVTKGRTIHIDGTVQAPSGTSHQISTSFTSSKASAITLLGSAKSGSTPTLKAAADNRVLSILTYVPVRIQNLKITGGSTSSNGAGIYATADGAKLTLGEGAEVSGNTTTGGQGGGVWFGGTGTTSSAMGTLIMESTAKIQGNECGNGGGGGIYLKNANLYMTGSSLVGDNSSYDTGATSSSCSNLARYGGGICADGYAAVYIGYAGDGSISEMTSGYGVCHNYAQISGGLGGNGGGIFLSSSTSALYMGSGSISKNGAGADGGGICNGGKVFLHTKAMVGDSRTSAATASANSNVAAGNGGGIYSGSGSYVALGYESVSGTSWTAKTLNNGYGVVGNYANEGGGVYAEGASGANVELRMASGAVSANFADHASSTSVDYGGGGIYTKNTYVTVYMSGGTISDNMATAYGGGALIKGPFYMSGNAAIGKLSVNASSYAQNTVGSFSNWAGQKGGGVYVASSGSLYMGYKSASQYDDDFNGGIAYNYAGMAGGGVHNVGSVRMAGGTIKSNFATYSGGAICQSSWFYMGGEATIPAGTELKYNGFYLNGSTMKISGFDDRPLTGSSVVAKICPNSYEARQVLSDNIKASAGRFPVFPNGEDYWTIDSGTGKLKRSL